MKKETVATKLVKVGIQGLKVDGSAWSLAGDLCIEADVFQEETQKGQANRFYKYWGETLDKSVFPKGKAKNRKGENFDLLADDGTPKLSQWDATFKGAKAMNEMTKYTRTYAEQIPEGEDAPRGMERALDDFFPKGKVISGRKMREMIGKIEKDPLANIERATKLIQDSIGKVDPDEMTRMDACYEILVRSFSEWKVTSTLKKAA